MINRFEKLCLLSEMIAIAKGDNDMKNMEYHFLFEVAQQLKISREDFDYLIQHPVSYTHLQSHSERIVQFHRLVLLMSQDGEITSEELAKLYNFGIKTGLSQESISKVLFLMEGFPDKIVPAEVLIDVFKVQYN
ncbi:hypothetical protein [Oceanihabitans sediminis]|uniref:TerB family tellurite resistance protein n=1 Tax=Oceanihabitans sediminis TaxID=1812012 RepID=A0A368P4L3_9FLAO|nr:hypothetical protein [Oceanihabitans sediminis]MDX1278135.1 TerB family tellurite resistance protein [Oceanihabitans sediminis]MDX1774078.1 TerB family tellurite resistance protein [Oceanihabitans sediminis]RBP30881.1 hypothetical protein DFR65_104139 [Oceanihabitans sediminis]RCU56845.1 TerB family tellurite resistance protein [Oceanihabitans sediminis]